MNQFQYVSAGILDFNIESPEHRSEYFYEIKWYHRFLTIAIGALTFINITYLSFPYLSQGAGALVIIPVAFIAWTYGRKSGILVSIVAVVFNHLIMDFFGVPLIFFTSPIRSLLLNLSPIFTCSICSPLNQWLFR